MTDTHSPHSSEAHARTSLPRRYMVQLCKHFEHRVPVTLTDWQGRIEFPSGICELDAAEQPDTLTMRVSTGDEQALAGLEDVVGRHLKRFAFREELDINWTRNA